MIDIHTYHFRVGRVIDGDSIEGDILQGFSQVMEDVQIRVWGIDAHEKSPRKSKWPDPVERAAEKARGKAAHAYMKAIVKTAMNKKRRLIIQTALDDRKQKGKFGRVLAVLFPTDATECDPMWSLNYLMLSADHAVPYFGGKKGIKLPISKFTEKYATTFLSTSGKRK